MESEPLEDDKVDVDIYRSKETIANLDKQHDSHRVPGVHSHSHSTISHVTRLPPELVSEIFIQCLKLAKMRGVLCQICQAWRQIAISTPVYGPTYR